MKRTEEEPYGGGEPYPLGTYTDYTGTDLMQFLVDTLQNNPKDRLHLLKIEKQLTDLIKDPKRTQHKFGPMSSYHRMLVHRVAAFFGMNHNVISVDNSVIVSKTRTTRLPKFKFSQQIKSTYEPEPPSEPVRSIIKRDSSSSEKGYLKDKSPDDRPGNHIQPLADTRRSKSLEEREEEYEKARARIFNQDSTSSTETPSDACANTSITDDSVATTSSGIVLSTNSSLNFSHESNEGSSSSKSRFLRLQRQKRLPDSFDSADSARTSFISTSSSMSSTSGMFLSPDSCLTAQKSPALPAINPVSSTTSPIPLCYIHPTASLPTPPPHQPSMNHHHHQHHQHHQHHNKLATRVNSGQNTRIYSSQCHSADQRYLTNATTANPHNQQMGRPPENYPSNGNPDLDMLGQSSSPHKSNLILLGSQLPVNTSSYGSYQPIPLQRSPLRAVPQVQSLVPSFQNQPQTNRMPNVPFNLHPIAVSSVPASAPSSSRSGTLVGHQLPVVTGNGPRVQLPQSSIGCNNGLINHANFPYAINHHVSLPPAHTNGGQLATATNFSYVPSMQVPPTIPMYVNTNGGNNFAPNQLTGAHHHPMPSPNQAQIIQPPYSPQNPVYRPVQLFFVFNFQNKRNN